VRPILQFVPLSKRLLRIVWPFLLVVILLVALSDISMNIMSSVRAYVSGESLWSKAQKESVAALNVYGRTLAEGDWQRSRYRWATAARAKSWNGPSPTWPLPGRASSMAATILKTSTE